MDAAKLPVGARVLVDGFTAGRPQEDDLTGVVIARSGDGAIGGWQVGGRS